MDRLCSFCDLWVILFTDYYSCANCWSVMLSRVSFILILHAPRHRRCCFQRLSVEEKIGAKLYTFAWRSMLNGRQIVVNVPPVVVTENYHFQPAPSSNSCSSSSRAVDAAKVMSESNPYEPQPDESQTWTNIESMSFWITNISYLIFSGFEAQLLTDTYVVGSEYAWTETLDW